MNLRIQVLVDSSTTSSEETKFNWKYEFCSTGIRRLQSVLLKVALVLGVRVYEGVEFVDLVEPNGVDDEVGWRMKVNPNNHPLNKVNVDMLIGAEGKRVTIPVNIFKSTHLRNQVFTAVRPGGIWQETAEVFVLKRG